MRYGARSCPTRSSRSTSTRRRSGGTGRRPSGSSATPGWCSNAWTMRSAAPSAHEPLVRRRRRSARRSAPSWPRRPGRSWSCWTRSGRSCRVTPSSPTISACRATGRSSRWTSTSRAPSCTPACSGRSGTRCRRPSGPASGGRIGRSSRSCGDGGFLYTSQELATAVQEQADVVAIVFNDNAYGALKLFQDRHHGGRRIGVELKNPDFAKLGRGVRRPRHQAAAPAPTSGSALADALGQRGPAVIECPLDFDLTRVLPPWMP